MSVESRPILSRQWFHYYQWPLSIIMFFVLLASANVWLLITAVKGRPGTIVENPYQSALNYESVIQMKSIATRYGMNAQLKFSQNSTSSTEVSLSLQSKLSAPPASVDLSLKRADDSSLDATASLSLVDGQQQYRAELPTLKHGLWFAELRVTTPEGVALIEQKEFVNP